MGFICCHGVLSLGIWGLPSSTPHQALPVLLQRTLWVRSQRGPKSELLFGFNSFLPWESLSSSPCLSFVRTHGQVGSPCPAAGLGRMWQGTKVRSAQQLCKSVRQLAGLCRRGQSMDKRETVGHHAWSSASVPPGAGAWHAVKDGRRFSFVCWASSGPFAGDSGHGYARGWACLLLPPPGWGRGPI